MSLTLFTLFFVTSIANIAAPGMGVAMIVMLAANYGWRRMIWGSAGLAFGIVILFALALSGVGVVVATSPRLFSAVKVAGSFVLFWMAWKTWRKDVVSLSGDHGVTERDLGVSMFRRCTLLSLANPQPLVFGVSVLPQFIDPQRGYLLQAAVYTVLYGLMVFGMMMLYSLLASRMQVFLREGRGAKILQRASAVVFALIGAAVLAAAAEGFLAA